MEGREYLTWCSQYESKTGFAFLGPQVGLAETHEIYSARPDSANVNPKKRAPSSRSS